MEFKRYKELVGNLPFGKRLPEAIYIHACGRSHIPHELDEFLSGIIEKLGLRTFTFDVIKLYLRDFRISLLSYPGFFDEAYPPLTASCLIDLIHGTSRITSYLDTRNPPILHRKETFLPPDHPMIETFAALTAEGETAGLYENTSRIGFKQSWERLIRQKGYELVEGHLVKAGRALLPGEEGSLPSAPASIERHKTALSRYSLSAPMQTLARNQYLDGNYSVMDYGCGKGDDVRELEAHGITVSGWDPVFRPEGEKQEADIVNLGFVINVIENPQERSACLQQAYALARRLLVVSAMLGTTNLAERFRPYGDGVLTSRNTFQKYYSQQSLKDYIETVVKASAIAVAPGIYYVFRNSEDEQVFLARRQQRDYDWISLSKRVRIVPEKLNATAFTRHAALLTSFRDLCLALGRLPAPAEFDFTPQLRSAFGSVRKAYDLLQAHYGAALFAAAAQDRKDDLLVYLALGLFQKRKPYTHQPDGLKRDINEHFASYPAAIDQARALLFSIADPAKIDAACRHAAENQRIGYLEDNQSLQFHRSQLPDLPPILRVYVGCATQLYGDLAGVDLIKIHIRSGKVSLMIYEDFENSPLPRLKERIKVKLRTQEIDFFDYVGEFAPQPLYLKSRYIPADFSNFAKQQKFDQKLSNLDFLDLSGYGPARESLDAALTARQLKIRGFQIVRQKAAG